MISSAFAQSAAGGAGGFSLQGLLPFVLIFIIFYFLLIRPQQKRVKQHKLMVENLKRGNKVLTAGGIMGVISKANEGSETVSVEISQGVIVDVSRQMISEVRGEEKLQSTSEKPKAKLKPKKSAISAEMLDTANTYDDKVAVIRMIDGDEAGRVSSVFKGMMEKDS